MINWKVRIKNKTFWITMIPAILLLITQILTIFGVTVDFTELNEQLISVVGTIFSILAILGIVADPTTEGISDSARALTYEKPNDEK